MTVGSSPVSNSATESDQARISAEYAGSVATVVLGAGFRCNALRTKDWIELKQVFEHCAEIGVTVVVLRGAQHTFSSGSDLTEWMAVDGHYVDWSFTAMEAAMTTLEQLDAVSIAAIEGVATGAACELALSCDMRHMAATARIGMPVVRHGIRVSASFALRLIELVGVARARDMFYTGRLVDAEVANAWGLTSRVAEAEKFDDELADLVRLITSQPRNSILAAKQSTNRVLKNTRTQVIDSEWRYTDAEFSDRISAFVSRTLP